MFVSRWKEQSGIKDGHIHIKSSVFVKKNLDKNENVYNNSNKNNKNI